MKRNESINTAVALSWDGDGAPRVSAKGHGEVAQHIRAIAEQHDIPISDDPELVEILATVDIGAEVPPVMFAAVAEVIAFAYSLRQHLPDEISVRLAASDPRAVHIDCDDH